MYIKKDLFKSYLKMDKIIKLNSDGVIGIDIKNFSNVKKFINEVIPIVKKIHKVFYNKEETNL